MINDSIRAEILGEDIRAPGQSIEIDSKVVGGEFISKIERSAKSYRKDFIHNSQQEFVNFLEQSVKDRSITKLSVQFDCKDFYIQLKSGIKVEIKEIEISSEGIVVTTERSSIGWYCIGDEITREFLEDFKVFSEASQLYSHIADHFLSVTYYDLEFTVKELDNRITYIA